MSVRSNLTLCVFIGLVVGFSQLLAFKMSARRTHKSVHRHLNELLEASILQFLSGIGFGLCLDLVLFWCFWHPYCCLRLSASHQNHKSSNYYYYYSKSNYNDFSFYFLVGKTSILLRHQLLSVCWQWSDCHSALANIKRLKKKLWSVFVALLKLEGFLGIISQDCHPFPGRNVLCVGSLSLCSLSKIIHSGEPQLTAAQGSLILTPLTFVPFTNLKQQQYFPSLNCHSRRVADIIPSWSH